MIVIAGPQTTRSELRRLGVESDALIFDSLEALDRWRAVPPPRTIAAEVESALAELGRDVDDLGPQVRAAVERIARGESVPRVHELFGVLPERTFYRRWSESMPLSPRDFLARVRLLHARRLLDEDGCTAKETAYRAGFRSTWHLNRALGRNRGDVAGKRVAQVPMSPQVIGIS